VTFFVDANVVVYSAVPSEYREGCLQVLEAMARGDVEGRMSTAVLEEVWHIERSGRAGRLDGLTERAYTLFTPLLPVTDQSFRLALAVEAPQLGTNDRLHAGTCLAHEVGVIVSADAGFDGVRGIRRVDPLDARSRRRLLASGR
jgi:predicted nucleic acid-binding protein